MTAENARQLALALPDSIEQDHHGRPSFRVDDTIFATLWNETTMNVMLDEPGIRTTVHAHPESCSERYWGHRLAAVAVALLNASERELAEILADAWTTRTGRPLSGDELPITSATFPGHRHHRPAETGTGSRAGVESGAARK